MGKNTSNEKIKQEPIAVIGIGCKFPDGSNSTEKVWEILSEGKCIIRKVPISRWDADAMYDPDPSVRGKINTKYGGFVEDSELENFDPYFFGIAPVVAEKMDIQQRWMLEVCYRAVEDSGHDIQDLSGQDVAVFAGVSAKEYGDMVMSASVREIIDGNSILGTSSCIISNRISYTFNLKGPSLTVDTACSSSLVGLHFACKGIWAGEFSSALVGGVNTIISPEVSLAFSTGGYLSPDGLCRAFDHRANGYVRSEGAAAIYLKPLSQALKDKDHIYSTIIGSAVNQDGNTPGISYPNRDSQIEAIKAACRNANIEISDIQYVEAHGTGTAVGDKIEATSVGIAIGTQKKNGNKLYLGSVKTNYGHMEPASGMAGIVKLLLSMKHGKIPANLHLEKENPEIPFSEYNMIVPRELVEWKAEKGKRTAGINSFGFGGTNAHIILQQDESWTNGGYKVSRPQAQGNNNIYLFTCSAKTKKALDENISNITAYLNNNATNEMLGDICYSVNARRSHFTNRVAFIASSKDDLLECLSAFNRDENSAVTVTGKASSAMENAYAPVFFFSGQGPQWWGMARNIYRTESVFARKLDECEKVLSKFVGWSLTEELLKDEEDSLMHTEISQPILLAIQIALAEFWISLGLEPGAVVGHSIGEVSAAHIGGIITLEEAFKIVVYRMKILEKIASKGTMLAVGVSEREAMVLIKDYEDTVEIGTINGLNLITLTGVQDSLEKIAANLEKNDIFNRFLKVTGPFHSRFLDEYKDEILEMLKDITPKPEKIPVYSTVTGKREEKMARDAEYWYRNLRSVVRFPEAVENCIRDGYSVFIEINVHPILSNYVTEIIDKQQIEGLVVPSLNRKEDDSFVILKTLGTLYCNGYHLKWDKIYRPENYSFVQLPGYSFQKEKYWKEKSATRLKRSGRRIHPYIEKHTESVRYHDDHIWEINLDTRLMPYIAEHVVEGDIIFPAAGYCELALACGYNAFGEEFGFLEDLSFQKGLYLPSGEEELPDIQFNLTGEDGAFSVYSRDKYKEKNWIKHINGFIRHKGEIFSSHIPVMKEVRATFTDEDEIDFDAVYKQAYNNGLQLGNSFTSVNRAWYRRNCDYPGEVWGEVVTKEKNLVDLDRYYLHPVVWDCAWQIFLPIVTELSGEDNGLALPVHIDRIKYYKRPGVKFYSFARLLSFSPTISTGNVWVYNEDGECCMEIQGFSINRIKGVGRLEFKRRMDEWIYRFDWEPCEESDVIPTNRTLPGYLNWDGCWLVFADKKGIASYLAKSLMELGEDVILVEKSEQFKSDTNRFLINPGVQEHYSRLATDLGDKGKKAKGIIHLWNMDNPDNDALDSHIIEESLTPGSISLLYMYKELTSMAVVERSHIWVGTSGATYIPGKKKQIDISLSQTPAIGIVRVAMHEYMNVGSTLIDLEKEPSKKGKENFFNELFRDKPAEEVAYRGNSRYLNRFIKTTQDTEFAFAHEECDADKQPYELVCTEQGNIDNLVMQKKPVPAAGPEEICIKVSAAGISRKDIAFVSRNDMHSFSYDGYTGSSIGMECSGKIVALGKRVRGYNVGDSVFAICPKAFGSHVVANIKYVFKVPDDMDVSRGSAIPVNYLIAGHALIETSLLTAGQIVFIKGGENGSAVPAIILAKKIGATVLVQVESDIETEILKEAGADYIITGLSQLQEISGENSVDVVLNLGFKSLEYRDLCLLGKYGKAIDLSKQDSSVHSRLALAPFSNNLTFSVLDIDELLQDRLDYCRATILKVVDQIGFEACEDKFLSYHHVSNFREAFQAAKAGELKKTILQFSSSRPLNLAPYDSFDKYLDKNGSYIITGGFSGLGLYFAESLSRRGVKSLILISRSGASTKEAQEAVQRMKENGTKVHELRVDISDNDLLEKSFSKLDGKILPVKGLIHCAVVFDDALMRDMTEERFLKSVKPKAIGAWNMHKLTENMDLDFFVLFSSVAAEYGNAAQANYAAGNVFSDALAYYRKINNLPGISISWGVISGVGFVARNEKVAKMLELSEWGMMLPDEVEYITESLILQGHTHRMAMDLDWSLMGQRNPHDRESHRFGHLIMPFGVEADSDANFREEILAVDDPDLRKNILEDAVSGVIARILGTSADYFDKGDNILNLGIDSLMVNQLRNWIISRLRIDYPMMRLMKGMSIIELAAQLLHILENPDEGKFAADSGSKQEEIFLAPIPRAPDAENYPVSSSQKRLLVLNEFDKTGTAYNLNIGIIIKDSFDFEKGINAFKELVRHYDILRTSFNFDNGEFRQVIHNNVEIEAAYIEADEDEAPKIVDDFIRPFDFSKAPLCRSLLVKLASERYLFLIDIHHTLIDGAGGNLLLQDFLRLYASEKLEKENIKYRDYAVWQQNLLQSDFMKRQENYWLERFGNDIPVLDLKTDFPRGKYQNFEGDDIQFSLDAGLTKELRSICTESHATLYMAILSVFYIILHKYTSQEDIVIGLPILSRRHPDLEDLMGMLVNTLALRSCPRGDLSYRVYLEEVKDVAMTAYDNQDYPFEELVEKLDIERDFSRNPLFDVAFTYHYNEAIAFENAFANVSGESVLSFKGIEEFKLKKKVSHFDLSLYGFEKDDEIHFNLTYCSSLFRKETIERFVEHFKSVVRDIAADPGKKICDISLISNAEKTIIADTINKTSAEFPDNKLYIDLFEEQVKKTPERPAVFFNDTILTYRELNEKANIVGNYLLKEHDIQPDDFVALKINRSEEMIIAIMGVLKSGAAYLPIAPDSPTERMNKILDDARPKLVIGDIDDDGIVSVSGILHSNSSTAKITRKTKPENLAYLVYTSGSTGMPKGVRISNRGLVNYVWWVKGMCSGGPDNWCLLSSYAFDLCVTGLFTPFITGGGLVLYDEDLDVGQSLERALKDKNVTAVKITPSHIGMIEYLPVQTTGIGRVFVGGEKLKAENIRTLRRLNPDIDIVNHYGPTECTVGCIANRLEKNSETTAIGKPISNMEAIILNSDRNLCPIGIAGELCVSGTGLSPGYLNQDELTNEKFIEHPYKPACKLYRTGDLARILPDGNIEIFGRIDSQVKIRGYRIELGEIEAALNNVKEISTSCVVIREHNGLSILLGYYVSEKDIETEKIRAILIRYLPDYLIPAYFVRIDSIPVNSNGKVLRNALPDFIGLIKTENEYIAPRDDIEKAMVNIWQDILGIEQIGIKDGFIPLGGDSIKAIQISAQMRSLNYKVEIADIFQYGTIEQLRMHIKELKRRCDQGIVEGEVLLTPVQHWYFQTDPDAVDNCSQLVLIKCTEKINDSILKEVLDAIIRHHDALRLIYERTDGRIIQRSRGLGDNCFHYETYDMQNNSASRKDILKEVTKLQERLSLGEGKLISVGRFRTVDGDYLLLVIHNLVVDGVSWRILLEDLGQGYAQKLQGVEIKFADKTDSYRLWAEKLHEYAASGKANREKDYWKATLGSRKGRLGTKSGVYQIKDYKSIEGELSSENTEKLLKECNRAYNTRINDLLLLAFALAMKEWKDMEEVLVNLEGHGREYLLEDMDITRTVGWFASIFPVLLMTDGEDLSRQIKNMKETLRKIPNSGLGYGVLKYLGKENLGVEGDIVFSYLGDLNNRSRDRLFESIETIAGIQANSVRTANAKLSIQLYVINNNMKLRVLYVPEILDKGAVSKFIGLYMSNLSRIIMHCSGQKEIEYTPSDFAVSSFPADDDLTLDELTAIQDMVKNL
ncbi:MAG: amino acid adenylation domain-containing protein [Spirochaetales bacterium]|nr:amino acid adenylation domain-containing protein [Spirochaetales bacterium]